MKTEFPPAVPEIPVAHVDHAVAYYVGHLGFCLGWGGEEGAGIAGISKGNCRLFLTSGRFREMYGNAVPVVIWLNLNSREEVDALYQVWRDSEARIVSTPESKP